MRTILTTLLALLTYPCLASKPLPVSKAFLLHPPVVHKSTIDVKFSIKKGHYLYKNRIKIKLISKQSNFIKSIHFPKPKLKRIQRNERAPVYTGEATIRVEFNRVILNPMQLEIQYQGCAAKGYCYPPQVKILNKIKRR